MKTFLFTILLLCSNYVINAQGIEEYLQVYINNFKNPKDKLVKVGFSTAEVKSKLGNPSAVEGGFPDNSEMLVTGSPKLVGQINYSTWFYMSQPKEIELPGSVYFINGELVEKNIFESYKDVDFVYVLDGKVLVHGMGSSYELVKKTGLRKIPINRSTTGSQNEGTYKMSVVPLYCVIFDKGTQVVAGTKAYFLR